MEDKTTVLPKKEGTTLRNKPIKPDIPKKPSIPKKPVLPQTEKDKPATPAKPERPKQAEKSNKPVKPEKPTPAKPEKPTPVKPEKPAKPEKPTQVKPEKPAKPEKPTPAKLEKPAKPEKPVKPDKLEKPKKINNEENKNKLANETEELKLDIEKDKKVNKKEKTNPERPKKEKQEIEKSIEDNDVAKNQDLKDKQNEAENIEKNTENNEKIEENEVKNSKNKKNKKKDKLDKKEEEDFKLKSKNDDLIEESLQNTDLNQVNKKRKKKRLLLLILLLLLIPILVGLGVMLYYIFNYNPPEVIYHTNIEITDSEIEKQYDENNKEITYLPGNYVKYTAPIKISSKAEGEEVYYPMVFRFKIHAYVEGKVIENGLGVSFKDDSIIYKINTLPLLTDHEGHKYYTISNDYYFYCTEIIVPGQTVVETVDKLYLNPAVLNNEFANKKLEIILTAESIYPQASYFDEAWPESEQEYREMIIAKLENNLY